MNFDTFVQTFAEAEFVAALFRICFYLVFYKTIFILIIFCGGLQVVLVIFRSISTRIALGLYIILMTAFARISVVLPDLIKVGF